MCLLGSDVHQTLYLAGSTETGSMYERWTDLFLWLLIDFVKYPMAVIHTLITLIYAVHESGSTPYHVYGGNCVLFLCVVLTLWYMITGFVILNHWVFKSKVNHDMNILFSLSKNYSYKIINLIIKIIYFHYLLYIIS